MSSVAAGPLVFAAKGSGFPAAATACQMRSATTAAAPTASSPVIARRDRERLPAAEITDRAIALLEVAYHPDLVPLLGMTDVVDRDVVVLAPEEGHVGKGLAPAENVACRPLALSLRDDPVLDANGAAMPDVGIAGDVARGEDAGGAGLEVLVDHHASLRREPRTLGQLSARVNTDAGDDDLRGDLRTVVEGHRFGVDPVDGVPEMKDDAMRFVQTPDEVAELRPQHPLQRPLLGRDDVHLEPARAQRRGDLEPDEAPPDDDRTMRVPCGVDDLPAVGVGSQVVHAALPRDWSRQPHRLGAGREQQSAKLERAAVVELDPAARGVDRRHATAEEEANFPLLVEFRGVKGDPIFRRGAGEIVLGEVGPVVRHLVLGADHRERALVALPAKPLRCGVARGARADDHHRRRVGRDFAVWRGRKLACGKLAGDEEHPVALLDSPASDGVERRSAQRLAGAEAEAGVMPGAAHRVADAQPLPEWAAVMGTGGPDGEDVVAVSGDEHRLSLYVAREHSPVGKLGQRDAATEVRAVRFRLLTTHGALLDGMERKSCRLCVAYAVLPHHDHPVMSASDCVRPRARGGRVPPPCSRCEASRASPRATRRAGREYPSSRFRG
jgi:hypothetical protein